MCAINTVLENECKYRLKLIVKNKLKYGSFTASKLLDYCSQMRTCIAAIFLSRQVFKIDFTHIKCGTFPTALWYKNVGLHSLLLFL